MKRPKVYAHGTHAVEEAQKHAPGAVLKIFEDAKGEAVAQISLSRLVKPYEEFSASLTPTPQTLLVMLAGIEDPHNTGAIIRSAAALGAAAVLMPQEGQAPVNDTVIKVSAGMAFRIPLVSFAGYQQTLSDLRRRGFSISGLEANGEPLSGEPFEAPAVMVFGNEGAGLPGAVRPLCDRFLSIPMHPRAESLNVAAAAAVALYAWSQKHGVQ